MPVVFGPAPGPRNLPRGKEHLRYRSETTAITISARTTSEALARQLPPRFRVGDNPVLSVTIACLRNLGWLAGRGYNVVRVTFPVVFEGDDGTVGGSFVPVMWENMADPIVTGREDT